MDSDRVQGEASEKVVSSHTPEDTELWLQLEITNN